MQSLNDLESGNFRYKRGNQHTHEKQSYDRFFPTELKSLYDEGCDGAEHHIEKERDD